MQKIVLISIVLQCLLYCNAFAVDALRLVAVDVGEGQAVLLGRGERGILIDTGHFGRSFSTVESIKKHGVSRIDSVILTHLHPDHSSGIFTIMNEFPDATLYESGHRLGFDPNMDSYRWVVEELDSQKWQVKYLQQGDSIIWQDVKLNVLWPDNPEGVDLNYHSIVLLIKYGSKKILIMGDAGKEVETLLLNKGAIPENIDVLIVGHHGASDATSSKFIERTKPEHSVISTNSNNVRGYPASEVIEKLKKIGSKVQTTFEQGDIFFFLEK